MAKRKNEWTEKKIEKYMKEGRGSGEVSNYKPWLTIQNVPSHGNNTRSLGWKTNRRHEFLSNLERDYFFILEWMDDIIDIREQFPLNRELTYKIAGEKGINHPICRETDTLIVMTTDFLITIREGKEIKTIARTVKPSEQLEDKRIIEKFEIERAYWERNGIDWGIVTEKDIPIVMANNISWLYKFYYLDDITDIDFIVIFYNYLLCASRNNSTLIELFNQFDNQYNLESGEAINYFKHLVSRKYITVDMSTKKINLKNLTIKDISFQKGEYKNCDYTIC
ncbi:heteromeric transposase endonuclease subunit TnsA [Bacillus toyonensis]|uniref:TnsA endonuclease N-terminal domain-containing protein n=1 Tax=Bacillus cereus group TaxID=86661 RepID=UPI000BED4B60|nr:MULTISPECIES: TnsA endonuclease N-terminal domain-containing protein [Bacillus cereus group]PEG16425.1 heteromeric transposase endonuclease subunit TnsA [Bacillus toyonensis]PFL40526.1 heteromeric transposase endonuclease subunit TnsA [Bacillus cereus]PGA28353.1 heteromeric transposase endonuclease subunit TnsA [Bacillus thuringiensis]QQN85415.1 heteromeric transposase endonuclease subunit TnsA [Bacillus toyonensis]